MARRENQTSRLIQREVLKSVLLNLQTRQGESRKEITLEYERRRESSGEWDRDRMLAAEEAIRNRKRGLTGLEKEYVAVAYGE